MPPTPHQPVTMNEHSLVSWEHGDGITQVFPEPIQKHPAPKKPTNIYPANALEMLSSGMVGDH